MTILGVPLGLRRWCCCCTTISRIEADRNAVERPGGQAETSVLEDKSGERLNRPRADSDRVRRVDDNREGTREGRRATWDGKR